MSEPWGPREGQIREAIDRYNEQMANSESLAVDPPDFTTADVAYLLFIIDELRRKSR